MVAKDFLLHMVFEWKVKEKAFETIILERFLPGGNRGTMVYFI